MYKMVVIKSEKGIEIFLRWRRAYMAIQTDPRVAPLAALEEEDRAFEAVCKHFNADGIITWSRRNEVWHVWMYEDTRPKKYHKSA